MKKIEQGVGNIVKQSTLNTEKVEYSQELIRAVTNVVRLKILECIDLQGGTAHPKGIYETLNLEQSIVSQHLKIMKGAGIVSSEKNGKNIAYSLDYSVLERIENALNNFIGKKDTSKKEA